MLVSRVAVAGPRPVSDELREIGGELGERLFRDALDEAAPDGGDDAADLRVGVQVDVRLAVALGGPRNDRRPHAAAAARLVALDAQRRGVRRVVERLDGDRRAVADGDRAHLHGDLRLVGVRVDHFDDLGVRDARGDARDVFEDRPHALDRRVDVEGVVDDHDAAAARSLWTGSVPSLSRPPRRPSRSATISAAIEIAVSSGVRAPRSSPIGALMRASSGSVTPASRSASTRFACVRRLPIAPMYPAGVRSATCRSGMSNFTSWVSTMIAVGSATAAVCKNSSGQETTISSASGRRWRVANTGRASMTVTR